jgi:hypothetical protein
MNTLLLQLQLPQQENLFDLIDLIDCDGDADLPFLPWINEPNADHVDIPIPANGSIPTIGSIPAIAAINSRSDSDAGANYEKEGSTAATVGIKRHRLEHTEPGCVVAQLLVSQLLVLPDVADADVERSVRARHTPSQENTPPISQGNTPPIMASCSRRRKSLSPAELREALQVAQIHLTLSKRYETLIEKKETSIGVLITLTAELEGQVSALEDQVSALEDHRNVMGHFIIEQDEAKEATKCLLVAEQSGRIKDVDTATEIMQNMNNEIMSLRAELAHQNTTHAVALAEVQKQSESLTFDLHNWWIPSVTLCNPLYGTLCNPLYGTLLDCRFWNRSS